MVTRAIRRRQRADHRPVDVTAKPCACDPQTGVPCLECYGGMDPAGQARARQRAGIGDPQWRQRHGQ